jgi:hypothetical protein
MTAMDQLIVSCRRQPFACLQRYLQSGWSDNGRRPPWTRPTAADGGGLLMIRDYPQVG